MPAAHTCVCRQARWAILATVAWAALADGGPSGAALLVSNGRASSTIVLPASPHPVIRAAATDLQLHLRLMSGAVIPIRSEGERTQGTLVALGVLPPGVRPPVDPSDRPRFWPDGYLLMAGRDHVVVLSPRPEGVANGVYGILEDYLGCHWFTPGRIGMHVPKRRTVRLTVPGGAATVRPSFELRAPWYNGNATARQTQDEASEMALWRTRNRAGGMRGYAGQDWVSIFPRSLQESEPGLAALVNGRRVPRGAEAQICMSYPRAVSIARDYFVGVFRRDPTLDYYTFCPNDNDVWCECPGCLALGANPAERMLVFSNRVAEAVSAACPEKGLTILPYSSTIEPPVRDVKGAPNLYPIICSYAMEQVKPKTDRNPWCDTCRRRVERWMRLLPRAWSYDYIGWYPGPWTLFRKLQAEQDYYRRLGFSGMMPEYLDRNLGTDVHQWLSFRMAWDARQGGTACWRSSTPLTLGKPPERCAPSMRSSRGTCSP